ncbi:cellulose synthase-like protein E6 isoform X1 [Phoenix dactylifera]|uniref:Cellulose synthase-like protein E6 isoform X1 n=1 Tax=Phoenix dactylifera TaxID=42345 RepID=A0A8B9AEV0_PHODC|nr:cellulose synthase-like protein E6 isoform X1 [Phoenix dactylifera]
MDAGDLRRVMRSMGVDLWTLIETALDVAAADYGKELRARRDGIVERLYAAGPGAADGCRNCAPGAAAERAAAVGLSTGGMEGKGSSSPAAGKGAATASPLSMNGDEKGEEREEEDDDYPIDDKTKILAIKEFLEDPDQTEDSLVSLLQNLADVEFTFKNLKETDIGRHVNCFRKHPSPEVRQLVSDPMIEPPAMVISTVLSVMAYEYPPEKLSVYLSDDAGSELTFYALLEASRFAKSWIPFCKKFKVEPRSPDAYFNGECMCPKDGLQAVEWGKIKSLYTEMENRINDAVKFGKVSENIRKQHRGFLEWNRATTSRDHQAILHILIDGRDTNAIDDEGFTLPTLVYMAREKRPYRHHNFKAGAMNSLVRVSSEISSGAVMLNVDCDMYSSNSETVKDALCFLMDEEKGHEIAYVQLPQLFNNITKNDIYGSSPMWAWKDFHGLDGYGGPLYVGSGCFHRRESLCGKHFNETCKAALRANERNMEASASTLEERAKSLITCTYEDNTEWGKEMGLKYGCPVEDVITGLAIKCRGWKSIYFNPSRAGFLGVAPVTLAQTLVQHKRWSEGDFQIFLSKYCPFLYGKGKLKLGLQMGYSIYCLWAPCSFPTLYYVIIPPFTLLHGISLFPKASGIWFMPFSYVIAATTMFSLWEAFLFGCTMKRWWNEQRMYLFKRLASYPFAFVDTIFRHLGLNKSTFIITAKVADEEVSKRYKQEMMEFGSPSPMFTILATLAMLNLVCLIGGAKRLVLGEGIGLLGSMLLQFVLCASVVLINMPVYQAMFFRNDGGRMPTSITLTSVALAMLLAYMVPEQYFRLPRV